MESGKNSDMWTKCKESWRCTRPHICTKKEGRRRLIRTENIDDASIWGLEEYIKKGKGRLITAASKNRDNIRTSRTTTTRKPKGEEKQLCGYFKRQTSENCQDKTSTWLRKGNLKRETESFRIASQNNAIRTSYIKEKKSIIRNTIASVSYVVIETKPLII